MASAAGSVAFPADGAEVIAVDACEDAPAHGVADQSLVVTMTDADELSGVIGRLLQLTARR